MIERTEDGVIRLVGPCRLEEAEDLTRLLQAHPSDVDVSACTEMHGAVVQALIAFSAPLVGDSPAELLRLFIVPSLTSGRHAPRTDSDTAASMSTADAEQGTQAPGVRD